MSGSLWPHGLYNPWNSPGQNTGVSSLSLLQGIFPTQGLNPGLPHCRWLLYQLSHKGSPKILEWVAFSFFRGSSQPRNWIGASCIVGRFFTNWPIREAHCKVTILQLKINKLAAVDCGLCLGLVKDLKITGWKLALKVMDGVNLERSLLETRRPWRTPWNPRMRLSPQVGYSASEATCHWLDLLQGQHG